MITAGYYWVETDDSSPDLEICEWRVAVQDPDHGYWWAIGSGAYDDSPRVKRVVAGPIEPPTVPE